MPTVVPSSFRNNYAMPVQRGYREGPAFGSAMNFGGNESSPALLAALLGYMQNQTAQATAAGQFQQSLTARQKEFADQLSFMREQYQGSKEQFEQKLGAEMNIHMLDLGLSRDQLNKMMEKADKDRAEMAEQRKDTTGLQQQILNMEKSTKELTNKLVEAQAARAEREDARGYIRENFQQRLADTSTAFDLSNELKVSKLKNEEAKATQAFNARLYPYSTKTQDALSEVEKIGTPASTFFSVSNPAGATERASQALNEMVEEGKRAVMNSDGTVNVPAAEQFSQKLSAIRSTIAAKPAAFEGTLKSIFGGRSTAEARKEKFLNYLDQHIGWAENMVADKATRVSDAELAAKQAKFETLSPMLSGVAAGREALAQESGEKSPYIKRALEAYTSASARPPAIGAPSGYAGGGADFDTTSFGLRAPGSDPATVLSDKLMTDAAFSDPNYTGAKFDRAGYGAAAAQYIDPNAGFLPAGWR